MHILLVDDDPHSTNLVIAELTKLNHQCTYIEDSKLAIEAFNKLQPDLVLLDVAMPDLDGYTIAKQIRKINKEQSNDNIKKWTPIIFLSGKTSEEEQLKGFNVGGDDFITKPVNMKFLYAKIKVFQEIVKMNKIIEHNMQQLEIYYNESLEENLLAKNIMERMLTNSEYQSYQPFINIYIQPATYFNGDMVAIKKGIDNKTYLMISDARGHGLSASVLQIPTAHIFYDGVLHGYSGAKIINEINLKISLLREFGYFSCLALLIIDYKNKTIEIWNGGLPPFLVFDGNANYIEKIISEHPPIGTLDEQELDVSFSNYKWNQHTSMLLYSDGLFQDNYDDKARAFGANDIIECIKNNKPINYIQQITSSLKEFTGTNQHKDDITIISLDLP